ncbi:hypothetical protein BUPH_08446 (plasmid) [Paraburkholderia phenoliruptrix BR3459a]|uniref:Uncharacterized protein n=1 Tax=Paraburkholderia phenoliruptrix BR3459a TaxID=1229205 RepID=K0DZ30_9BURK|nr:hypothetical protein BUPH_08446 [Paraburkholderia phenoliruptrix BR3459a]
MSALYSNIARRRGSARKQIPGSPSGSVEHHPQFTSILPSLGRENIIIDLRLKHKAKREGPQIVHRSYPARARRHP